MTRKLPSGARLSKSESNLPAGGRILVIGRQAKINLAVLDLSRLIIGMKKELRRLLRDNIRFDVSSLASGGCPVRADSQQMRELLLHLVLDARDAMPDGGSLGITVEKTRIDEAGGLHPELSGDYVTVAVCDTAGLSGGRGSEKDVRVVKGRALSLAAGYDAIKRSGGHISVSLRRGETMVKIFLPLL